MTFRQTRPLWLSVVVIPCYYGQQKNTTSNSHRPQTGPQLSQNCPKARNRGWNALGGNQGGDRGKRAGVVCQFPFYHNRPVNSSISR